MSEHFSRIGRAGMAALAALAMATGARGAEPCGLCNDQVVTNSALATCFLARYEQLAVRANGAVVVDLSDCEQDRSVVEALPMPGGTVAEPDMQFMLTRAQLVCLKGKLEEPGLVLDPSAVIELGSCG